MSVANRYSDYYFPVAENLQLNVYKGIMRKIKKRRYNLCRNLHLMSQFATSPNNKNAE